MCMCDHCAIMFVILMIGRWLGGKSGKSARSREYRGGRALNPRRGSLIMAQRFEDRTGR